VKKQSLEPNHIVTKDKFLAVLARMQQQDEADEPLALRQPSTFSTTRRSFSPPPDLPRPHGKNAQPEAEGSAASDSSDDSDAEEEPPVPVAPEPQDGWQVLLRDLPELIAREPMMRVILEQANLDNNVLGMDFRAGGKVLIKFSTFMSVQQCIRHFNGRPWGSKGNCVSALYVRTVKGANNANAGCETSAATARPKVPVEKNMSADAPVFVPMFCGLAATVASSKKLSASACAFVPSFADDK
jgi:hypothetical protein